MLKLNYLNPRMLIADEGKVLTNGETYASVVYLGVDEDENNWSEIDKTENEENEENEE